MKVEDIKVGDVFKDGDHRVGYPYLVIDSIGGGKAQVTRSKTFPLSANGRRVKTAISLERLSRDGTRGYTKIEGRDEAPAPVLVVADATAVPTPGQTTTAEAPAA